MYTEPYRHSNGYLMAEMSREENAIDEYRDLGKMLEPDFEPPPLKDTIIQQLIEETKPVKPILSTLQRGMMLLFGTLGISGFMLILSGLRTDFGTGMWWVVYGPALFEMFAGGFAFFLSMGWAVPGSGGSRSLSHTFMLIVLVLTFLAAGSAPHLVSELAPGLNVGISPAMGLPCSAWQFAVAFPILLIAIWLLFRSASVASGLAGGLAGIGVGLISDSAIHLHCPAIDPIHTVVWHLGVILLLGVIGVILGKISSRWSGLEGSEL